MEKGKVQTVDDGTHVLVETDSSSNQHISHLDFAVECEKMTNKTIITEYRNRIGNPSIFDMKKKLQKIEGFAISQCQSTEAGLKDGDLVYYKKL